jgi:hypothetical protein
VAGGTAGPDVRRIAVQIQATIPGGREVALVVLTLTLDALLDLCLRLIAGARRLRCQAPKS